MRTTKIPQHVALIPDGNRRWAKEHGLAVWEGHKEGITRFEEFSEWCYAAGVKEITAYSISKENLEKRPKEELDGLFLYLEEAFGRLLESKLIDERKVHVEFPGETSIFPKSMQELIKKAKDKTENYDSCKLNLCFNYSGREEILFAAKKLCASGKEFNDKNFEDCLWVKSAPDLVIRTAEKRISNFLLWQSAYSELFLCEKPFPDFSEQDLNCAFAQYSNTERKFGK